MQSRGRGSPASTTILLLSALVLSAAPLRDAHSATYFVNPNNTDPPWVGSQTDPWVTINDAISATNDDGFVVRQGDEIRIFATVYHEQLIFRGEMACPDDDEEGPALRTASDGITLRSQSACPVILDGSTLEENGIGVTFQNNIGNITLDNFEIRNWQDKGIDVNMAYNITLRCIEVHNIFGDSSRSDEETGFGINLSSDCCAYARNTLISNCSIHDNSSHGIYMGGAFNTVRNSLMYRNDYGVHLYIGSHEGRVAHGNVVANNHVVENNYGVIVGGDPFVQGNRIEQNVICRNKNNGLRIQELTQSNTFTGNTVIANGTEGSGAAQILYIRNPDSCSYAPNIVRHNLAVGRWPVGVVCNKTYGTIGDVSWPWVVFDENTYGPPEAFHFYWGNDPHVPGDGSPPHECSEVRDELTYDEWRTEMGQDQNSEILSTWACALQGRCTCRQQIHLLEKRRWARCSGRWSVQACE